MRKTILVVKGAENVRKSEGRLKSSQEVNLCYFIIIFLMFTKEKKGIG